MENDDKDDGYSEEEEGESSRSFLFQNHADIDESMISQGPEDVLSANVMADKVMYEESVPIELLAGCANSAHWLTRNAAARTVLKAIHSAVFACECDPEKDDVEKVFYYIDKLSKDSKETVRDRLLDALPEVIRFCVEYDGGISLKEFIETDILPIALNGIADEAEGFNIRKKGYNVLRYLQNNELASQTSIEGKIKDLCLNRTNLLFQPYNINIISASNSRRTRLGDAKEEKDAMIALVRVIVFITRMAPIVGEATTEKLLLPKISELCNHPHPKVREACCFFLVDLACFVNQLVTENIIIPLFIKLSEDEAWCVRRACAETAVILSCLCLMETRMMVLSRVFLSLLQDSNITSIASKQFGPFISTFAQPSVVGLGCNRSGDYILVSDEGYSFEFLARRSIFHFYEQPEQNKFCMFMLPMKTENASMSSVVSQPWNDNWDIFPSSNMCNVDDSSVAREGESEVSAYQIDEENDVQTTHFPYPRSPEVDKNTEYLSEQLRNQPDLVQSCIVPATGGSQSVIWISNKSVGANCGTEEESSSELIGKSSSSLPSSNESNEFIGNFNSFQFWRAPIAELDEHEIVTAADSITVTTSTNAVVNSSERRTEEFRLMKGKRFQVDSDSGLSVRSDCARGNGKPIVMVANKQTVLPQMLLDAFISLPETMPYDDNVRLNCAYTFPAVALTLGTPYWFLLKKAYCKLAVDPEWKVREVIASSIHEIASILGSEIATQDLRPIYKSLINDVEDVRTTALSHLACFVRLLPPHGRYQLLPHLTDFVMADYSLNWRFRKQLCDQLIEILDLFSPRHCWSYVSMVSFKLLMDRVSEVRLQALGLVTNLIRVVSADMSILRSILAELAERFAHSKQWVYRQSFAFLCSSLSHTPVLPGDMFARDVLPHLLDLSWDSVPNVRIAVARTLSCDIVEYPNFGQHFSAHYDIILEVLKRLCKDKDRDVRYFAELSSDTTLPSLATFKKIDENVKDCDYDLPE